VGSQSGWRGRRTPLACRYLPFGLGAGMLLPTFWSNHTRPGCI